MHNKRFNTYLSISIQVPQIDPSGGVSGCEQRGVCGGPAHIHHVVPAVLERVQRFVLLGTHYHVMCLCVMGCKERSATSNEFTDRLAHPVYLMYCIVMYLM